MSAASDNVLQIVARFDPTSVKAGTDEAAAAVSSSVAKMSTSFKQLDSDTAADIAALKEQIASLSAQIDVMKAKLETAGRTGSKEMTEARHAIKGVSEEVGIHLPRFLQSFITQLPGVGSALASAFSAVAVIGIIQIVVELGTKIYELGKQGREAANALSSAFAEVRAQAELTNDELKLSNAELQKEIDKLEGRRTNVLALELAKSNVEADKLAKGAKEVAKSLDEVVDKNKVGFWEYMISGMARTKDETKFVGEAMQHYTDTVNHGREAVRAASTEEDKNRERKEALATSTKALANIQEIAKDKLADLVKEQQRLVDSGNDLVDLSAKMTILKNLIGIAADEMDRLANEEQRLKEEAQRDKDTAAASAAAKEIAREKSVVEAHRATREAEIALDESWAKQEYELGNSSHAKEMESLRSATQQRFALLIQSAEREREIAKKDTAEGKDPTPEINAANAKIIALKTQLNQKLAELDTENLVFERDNAKSVAEARINALKAGAEQEFTLAADSAKEAYEAKRISTTQEVTLETNATNTLYAAKKKALQDQIALLNENKEKNAAALITLNAELSRLATEEENELTKIKREGEKQRLEEMKASANEAVKQTEMTANLQLEATNKFENVRLSTHRESLGQWAADEKAALAKWYNDQLQILQQWIDAFKRAGLQESQEYKELLDKMTQLKQQWAQKQEAIDDQVFQKQQQVMNKVTSMFNSDLQKMALGQETFKQGWDNIWTHMLETFVSKMLTVIEQYVADQFTMTAAHAAMQTTVAAQDTAGAAVGLATQRTSSLKSIFIDAKTAAAHAFKWVMQDIPYPVNVVLAPATAAATFAAVAAFGSFDKGGVVPHDMIAMVHANEMVLPPAISKTVQNLSTSSRSTSSDSSSMNISPQFHYHGQRPANAAHEERELSAMVRRASRRGFLPSQ